MIEVLFFRQAWEVHLLEPELSTQVNVALLRVNCGIVSVISCF